MRKKTLETARQLLSYFTSMAIHLEESKLARAEICQPKFVSE